MTRTTLRRFITRKVRRGRNPLTYERRLTLETLEERRLLVSDFQNQFNEYDVNDDGFVAPLDALLIINDLNADGSRQLPAIRPSTAPYVDVTGDTFVSPIDVLIIINALNAGDLGNLVPLTEGNTFVQESYYDLTLPGIASGTRKITFDVTTRLDTTDQTTAIEDQLLVYLVDANDPQRTILDRGEPGTALFSLAASEADFPAGLVRFDGRTVEIDVSDSQLTGTVKLKLQLLNSDGDVGSRVTVRSFAVVTNTTGVPPAIFPQQELFALPASAVDLTTLAPAPNLNVEVTNVHFDKTTNRYRAELTVINSGDAVGRTTVVRFPDLPPNVTLISASGVDANGAPYINFSNGILAGGLQRGARTSKIAIEFDNPDGLPLPLRPEILAGPANSAPAFATIGTLTVSPGGVLEVPLLATDIDGDPISFALRPNGPLPNVTVRADGKLIVRPTNGQEGAYSLDLIASDGILSTHQFATLNVIDDLQTDTRVSGVVQLTDGTPVSNLRVEIGAVQGLTATDGSFTLNLGSGAVVGDTLKIRGELFSGAFGLPFIAEKLPLVLEHELYFGANNVISRPIFLPRLDLANGEQIDPTQEVIVAAENLPGVSVTVAAGTLMNQQGTPFTGVMSITEVPVELTPISLPPNLSPDFVVTVQPGEMIFATPAPMTFPNRSGWDPGTLMDLWSINPTTGQFDDVGDMRVSADGSIIETINGGVRNSSWHFVAPPPEEPNDPKDNEKNPDKKCDRCGESGEFTSSVDEQTGVVRESHELVTYVSLGETRGLTLNYNSLWADPREIVHFGYSNTRADADRLLVASMTLNRGSVSQQVPGFELPKAQATDAVDQSFSAAFDTVVSPSTTRAERVFSGTAGQVLQLRAPDQGIWLHNAGGGIVSVLIRDPGGNQIHNNVITRNGAINLDPFTLPTTGTYTIELISSAPPNLQHQVHFRLRDASDFGLRGGEHFWRIPGGNIDPALLVDMTQLPSGVYNYQLTTGLKRFTGANFTGSSFTSVGELVHVNRIGSSFGNGWGLAGLQELVENPDGSVLLIDGDGTNLVFGSRPSTLAPYDSPPGDFTRLEKLANGKFERTTTDQTVYKFNARNQIESVRDRNGNTTTYFYDASGNLTTVVDPVGLQTTLAYAGGRAVSITDPASRVTRLQYDAAGNLTAVINPDESRRSWEYDASRHIVAEIDQLGRREQSIYDFAGRAQRAILKDGSEIRVQPTQVQGLLPPSATVDPRNAPIAPLITPPTSSYADANGNVVTSLLDRAGQVVSSTDGVASLASVLRNSENLVTQVTNGRGQVTTFTYDVRGNVTAISDPLAFGQPGGGSGETIELNQPLFTAVGDLNSDAAMDLVTIISVPQGTAVGVQLRNSDGTFQVPVVALTKVGTAHVSLGDVDGDGDLDLITSNNVGGDASVGVQLGSGDGTFGAMTEYSAGFGLTSTLLQDLNADNRLDIITVNRESDSVSVLLNLGGGTFQGRIDRTRHSPTEHATADLNGDGWLDVLTADQGGDSLSLLIGSADGLQRATVLTLGENSPVSVAVGDLDGDGDVDLATVTVDFGGASQLRVFVGNGDGTFGQIAPISLDAATPQRVWLEDVDGDNDRDVLVGTTVGVKLIRNSGNLTFAAIANATAINAHRLALGDIDGDGDRDLITTASFDSTVRVWTNDGTGAFAFQASLFFGGNIVGLTLDDINGDSHLDVIAGQQFSANDVMIYQGDGAGEFSFLASFAVDNGLTALSIGDLDADGDLDLATATNYDNYYNPSANSPIFLNDGEGSFTAQTPVALPATLNSLSIADVNGDGRVDIVGASSSGNRVVIQTGSGNGTFFQSGRGTEYETADVPLAVAAGDFDADGDIDIVVGGGVKALSLLLNNGNGSFASGGQLPVTPGQQAIVVEDFDGDGDLDIGTAHEGVRRVGIFLGNGNGTFADRREYGTRGRPEALVAHDVDGDGDVDLLTISDDDSQAEVLLNAGDGTFPNFVLHTGTSPHGLLTGDINGDGRADLISAHLGGITLLRGTAEGSYAAAQEFSSGVDSPVGVALGDVDGDGDLDAVVLGLMNAFPQSACFAVLLNNNGAFAAPILRDVSWNPSALALGDIDGDGQLDLAVGDQRQSIVMVLPGLGDGNFGAHSEYAVGVGIVSLMLRDMNNDAHLDIVSANNLDGSVSVLTNRGNGTFPHRVQRLEEAPSAHARGDFNGDGHLDLIVASLNSNELLLMLGEGNGDFLAPTPLSVPAFSTCDVAVGDFNSDGKLDIVTVNNDFDSMLFTFFGNGDGTFAQPIAASVSQVFFGFSSDAIHVGDFTGDGSTDLLVVPEFGGALLMRNAGDGNWVYVEDLALIDVQRPLAPGDLDGDGDLDIVSADRVVLNLGEGLFGNSTLLAFPPGSAPRALRLADVDGDADLDIVAQQQVDSRGSVVILTNNGSAAFAESVVFALANGGFSASNALDVGDLDGDGDIDIATTTSASYSWIAGEQLSVLLGDGAGNFVAQATQRLPISASEFALASLNSDSRLDLLAINSVQKRIAGILAKSDGTFGSERHSAGQGPSGVTAGDVDGDGDLDLLVSHGTNYFYLNEAEANLSLLISQGDGTFLAPQALPVSSNQLAPVFRDLDGDGDLDIAAAIPNSQRLAVLLGNGDGTFAQRREYATRGRPTSLGALDADSDGDQDLVVSTYESSVDVLLNDGSAGFPNAALSTGPYPRTLATGDLDGDTYVDLVLVDQEGLSILRGASGGSFGAVESIRLGIMNIEAALVGDVDNDGDLDVTVIGLNDADPFTAGQAVLLRNTSGQLSVSGGIFNAGQSPYHAALGDIDGDGDLDVVTRSGLASDPSVAVLFGAGDGTFAAPVSYAAQSGFGPILLRDANADGALDIVTTNRFENSVSIIPNSGNGTFAKPLDRTGNNPARHAVGDFNGDGRPDVVTANAVGHSLTVMFGEAGGTFADPFTLSLGLGDATDVAIGDLDGDGDLDILATSAAYTPQSLNRVHLFLGQGDGSFTPLAPVSLGHNRPFALRLGDLESDGDVDVFVATNRGVKFLRNNGSANLGAVEEASTTAAEQFAVGDLDADGDLDVVVALYGGIVSTQLQISDGVFATADTRNSVNGGRATDINLSDIDTDGDLDVILVRARRSFFVAGDGLEVFANIGDGNLAAPIDLAVGSGTPIAVAVGDIDQDGDLDLAVADQTRPFAYYYRTQGNVTVYLSDGSGAFTQDSSRTVSVPLSGLTLAELDGDGILDLIGVSTAASRIVTLTGDGDGGFTEAAPQIDSYPAGLNPSAIAAGDVNGDGELDLVTSSDAYPPTVSLLLGQGSGAFAAPQSLSLGGSPGEVALADFDGDGDLDIAVSLPYSRRVAVLLGDGDGDFGGRREYATRGGSYLLSAIDTDRDGDLDLVVGSSDQNSVEVLLNLGNGNFPGQQLYTGLNPQSLAVADMNADGVADLVTANLANSISILLGGANGIFLPASDITSATANQGPGGTGFRGFEYDAVYSQVTRIVDELGRETLFDIDPANGNVLSSTQVVGQRDAESSEIDDIVTRFTYTSKGQVDTITDALGRVTDYDYDALGRIITVVLAKGTLEQGTRRYEHDAAGNPTSIIDENGNRTRFAYDVMNRATELQEADPDGTGALVGPVTRFEYDARGNLIEILDAAGQSALREYDARDRLVRTVDANDEATAFSYDRIGNLVAVVDPLGGITRNRYDARNRLIQTVDALGGATQFAYDADDNLSLVIDSLRNSTSYAYDQRNRLVEEVDPRGQPTSYNYDAADQLLRKTDRNNRKTTFTYDELGRLSIEKWISSTGVTDNTIAYVYDRVGNTVSVADSFSALAFTYDARDRVKTVSNAGTPGAPEVVLRYTYDAVGNVLSMSDTIGGSAGGANNYLYDALNRNTRITQSGNEVSNKRVDLSYNALGQFSSINRYSELAGTQLVAGSNYSYDSLNRLTSLTHQNTTATVAFYNFTYDTANRITQITSVDGVASYSYDPTGQLTTAQHSAAAVPDESYTYDANGNRTSSHLHNNGYSTGVSNRLLSDGTYNYTYDNEGNLIRRTEIATGAVRELSWDHRNRLVAVLDRTAARVLTQEVTFSYDALNRRISKAVDLLPLDAIDAAIAHFVYDREDVSLDFLDADGAGPATPTLDTRYLNGPLVDQVLAQSDGAGSVQWHLTDHLGSIRDLVDNAGVVVNHIVYDSFGNVASESNAAVDSRFLFTGRETDFEIGLYYYRARYYDSAIARFSSHDPIGFASGDTNTYRYVTNNPVLNVDPSGLDAQSRIETGLEINDHYDNYAYLKGKYDFIKTQLAFEQALDAIAERQAITLDALKRTPLCESEQRLKIQLELQKLRIELEYLRMEKLVELGGFLPF